MLIEPTAAELIARPRYGASGGWYDTRTHWTDKASMRLRILCEAGANLENSANALGRSPTSIAHRARDTGLVLPRAWAKVIAAKQKLIAPRIALAYPFIIQKRDEHADLLAVNSLVPSYLPGREDVCQEIMLALWEQKITLDQLKANRDNVREFVRSFRRSNMEAAGYAISLDQPMYDGRSWHDVLPAEPLDHEIHVPAV